MQVWLQGRIDPSTLREALARLARVHPVVTSRLVEDVREGRAFWCFRPDATCELHEHTLTSADETAVLDRAAGVLSGAADPTADHPVTFHLLRRPDGRDVLLVQHDHGLMDIHGTRALLREIDRLSQGLPPTDDAAGGEDGTRAYLRRFRFWQRWRAAGRLVGHHRPMRRFMPLTLCDAVEPVRGGSLRMAVRELDERQTAAFLERTLRPGGCPSPSMAVLASVFRGILRHTPHPVTKKSVLLSGTGTNHRGRTAGGPIFRNLGSVLSFLARPEDVGERDGLVQLLTRQLREQTRRGTDLGLLQWVWWLRHCRGFWRRHVRQAMHHHSVNYGYVGRLVAEGDCFCGVPIDRQLVTTTVWSPPALAVAPSLCRGRLMLPATYMADTIPESRVRAFLDTVAADLVD